MEIKSNVRVPQVASIGKAIELYYSKTELSNADITELFGKLSRATISRLKQRVREEMVKRNTPIWNSTYINTQIAYEMWGLNIEDLEKRFDKLKKLSLVE